MSDILIYLIILFMAVLGGGSTIYVVCSLPVVIIYKIHRKTKYGENLCDNYQTGSLTFQADGNRSNYDFYPNYYFDYWICCPC